MKKFAADSNGIKENKFKKNIILGLQFNTENLQKKKKRKKERKKERRKEITLCLVAEKIGRRHFFFIFSFSFCFLFKSKSRWKHFFFYSCPTLNNNGVQDFASQTNRYTKFKNFITFPFPCSHQSKQEEI